MATVSHPPDGRTQLLFFFFPSVSGAPRRSIATSQLAAGVVVVSFSDCYNGCFRKINAVFLAFEYFGLVIKDVVIVHVCLKIQGSVSLVCGILDIADIARRSHTAVAVSVESLLFLEQHLACRFKICVFQNAPRNGLRISLCLLLAPALELLLCGVFEQHANGWREKKKKNK
ncbi:hypothetical protein CEXT_276441 [Caerostris extrusa]|uniref:Uncharacterized protein n=1 Tax=Caerostris extrusa TaxID=172846 RepID=A0AAV4PCD0_CAEEX|nr:hypothetical protein CEXT_276441 [Caerostris extrusa]